jgi:hypothetical protein
MDEEQIGQLLRETIWRYGAGEIARVQRECRQFVHYTTTEAALSVIANGEIWLRNSGVMNDYSEIAHGEACLRHSFFENQEVAARSRCILDTIQEGLHDWAAKRLVESAPMRRAFTYLLSISEHGPVYVGPGVVDEESDYGRLSMWRAYGAKGGVALIFDRKPIIEPVPGLNAFSSPVFYGTPDKFAAEYDATLSLIERRMDEFKKFDPKVVAAELDRFIHFACLGTKHPGFAEEREWRVTYSANPASEHIDDEEFNQQNRIKREFRTVNGLPQRIYKVPFVDYPEEGVQGLTLPAILKRVVIGPTQYPIVIADALHVAMRRAGFTDDQIRISVSQIPLRT